MPAAALDDPRRPDRGAERLLLAVDLTAEASERYTRTMPAIDASQLRRPDYLAVCGKHVVLCHFSDRT